MADPLESLYNPPDSFHLFEWFRIIGQLTSNEASWMKFHASVVSVCGATSVGLLRKVRASDIDMALSYASMSFGYKLALSEYMVPNGKEAHVFVGDRDKPVESRKNCHKKFESQKDRMSLGNELGAVEVQKITLPIGLLSDIRCGAGVAMRARGRHSTSAVADRVWCWAVGRWGNLHIDSTFCDRIAKLLDEVYPILKPWGKKERQWSDIIKNRFNNAREADEKAYKTSIILSVELSSQARALLKENLTMRTDDAAPSMYSGAGVHSGDAESPPAPATGVPLMGAGTTGVRVARGVPVAAAQSLSQSPPFEANTLNPDDSEDDEEPLATRRRPVTAAPAGTSTTATSRTPASAARPKAARPAPARRTPARAPAAAAPPAPARPPPAVPPSSVLPAKKRKAGTRSPAFAFGDSDLAAHFLPLSEEEAKSVGNNVKDAAGLGRPALFVAKLFPLKDGGLDWFLATINTELRLKNFFWVTFVEDGAEYRIKFFPTKYNVDWIFLRRRPITILDEPEEPVDAAVMIENDESEDDIEFDVAR